MKKRLGWLSLISGIAAAVCCCMMAGCSSVSKYNAVLYDSCSDWINEDFLQENMVRGIYYENPDYVEGVSDRSEQYYYCEDGPKNLTYVITDEDTFSSVFKEGTIEADLDTQTVYLYIFGDTYLRSYTLKKIKTEDDTLYLYIAKQKGSSGNVFIEIYRRCMAVVMDNSGITNVEFVMP
ncbi:MAG: hypothetical protein LUE27_03640 [Clostridia bacterium]|nr:hypothetical protein [Clostridia bacterium]